MVSQREEMPATPEYEAREALGETIANLEVVIPPGGIDLHGYFAELETAYFQKVIVMKEGNQAAAARLLCIQPHTFRKRAREKFGF